MSEDVKHGLFGPGIFGTGIDLSALDEDTALRLGVFFGEQLAAAEQRGRLGATSKFRQLAGKFLVGWEQEPDPTPTYIAYGQAFQEAARRINELAGEMDQDPTSLVP